MENPFQLNFSNMFLRPFFLSKTTINWLYKIYLIDYLAHPDCEGEDCSPTYKKLTQIGPQWFINPVGRQTLTNVYIYPGAIRKKMEAALKIIRPL